MKHVQLVAASLAAGTTLGLLWMVVSIAEPQRSSLQARLHHPEAKTSQLAASTTQPVSPRSHELRTPREDM